MCLGGFGLLMLGGTVTYAVAFARGNSTMEATIAMSSAWVVLVFGAIVWAAVIVLKREIVGLGIFFAQGQLRTTDQLEEMDLRSRRVTGVVEHLHETVTESNKRREAAGYLKAIRARRSGGLPAEYLRLVDGESEV